MCFLKFFRTNIRLKCRRVRLWQEFLKIIQFQKTDLNTVKELKEDCWRKAQGEDLEAFLGFYLKKKPARSWQIAAWAALFVFLISAGELGV